MSESVARSFFVLAYEHILRLLPLALLRALPWTGVGLLLSYGPYGADTTGRQLLPLALLVGLALLLAPWTAAAAHLVAAALSRGEEPALGAALRGARARYGPLLAVSLGQALLLLLVIRNTLTYFALPSEGRGFMMHLGLAAGFWLWTLGRIWLFLWLPLMLDGPHGAAGAGRLALLLIVGEPRLLLRQFILRQALALLLILSGLGLFFGLGSLLPLHASLSARAGLSARGLLGAEAAAAPAASSWRKILRPWE